MTANATLFKYQELKESFIRSIREGRFAYNDRIPSEPELMLRYKLSRNTIRQAMKELESDGYLYRIRGKGTFVKTICPEISKKIALIIFNTEYATHPLVAQMIRGIDEVLSKNGFMLDILASHRDGHEADICKLANNYAGFLIGSWQLDKNIIKTMVHKNIPHIFVKNYFPGMKKNAVLIDFEKAGSLITEHLAGLGHKNIALLYAGEEITISRDFKAGVISTCLENGIKLSQKNIIDIGFDSKKAAKAVDSFLQAAPEDRVSAIITLDDEIAATVIQQINAKGLKVPQDISVTGCNNIPLASLITPALTTLTVPIKELGRQAAGVLLRRLKEGPQEFKGIKLEPEITIRESTGKQKVINSNM